MVEKIPKILFRPILIPPEKYIWIFAAESAIMGFFLAEGTGRLFLLVMVLLYPSLRQNTRIVIQDFLLQRKFLRKYVATGMLIAFLLLYGFFLYLAIQRSLYPFFYFFFAGLGTGLFLLLLEISGYYRNLFVDTLASFSFVLFSLSFPATVEWNESKFQFLSVVLLFRFLSYLVFMEILERTVRYGSDGNFWYVFAFSLFMAVVLYFFYFVSLPVLVTFLLYLAFYVIIYQLVRHRKIQKFSTVQTLQFPLGILYAVSILYPLNMQGI